MEAYEIADLCDCSIGTAEQIKADWKHYSIKKPATEPPATGTCKMMETKVAQQIENKKRYVVTVSFYMDAADDKQVVKMAHNHTMELNRELDCRASVDGIVESQFGKIGHRKVY